MDTELGFRGKSLESMFMGVNPHGTTSVELDVSASGATPRACDGCGVRTSRLFPKARADLESFLACSLSARQDGDRGIRPLIEKFASGSGVMVKAGKK